jgi:integrase
MSVHRRERKVASGDAKTTWIATWREDGRQRSLTFNDKPDAEAYDAEVTRRLRLGTLYAFTSDRTLDEFVRDSWAPDRAVDLATSTRRNYANLYSVHIAPTFAATPIKAITAPKVASWRTQREKDGAGVKALREAHSLLGGILAYACELGELEANAARAVRPRRRRSREPVRAWSPTEVERLRAALLSPAQRAVAASEPGQRERKSYRQPQRDAMSCARDGALISALAYAGLRPAEALALRWNDVRKATILVARACDLAGGAMKGTKTEKERAIDILEPLAGDLREWSIRSGRPNGVASVFPSSDGRPWQKFDWDNWRRRRWGPALTQAGLPPARPYDLRHSFASLLIAEGRTPYYVAGQLGHGPEQTMRTYGHVIAEYGRGVQIDAEAEIRAAKLNACFPTVDQAEEHTA